MGRRAGAQAEGAGFVPAAVLATDVDLLERALTQLAEECGTERRDICAIRLIELWTWLVAAAAAETLLTAGWIPDVSPQQTRLTFDGPSSEWAASFGGEGLAGAEGEVLAILRSSLAQQLAPLVEMLNALTARPRRALWRGATDRLAGAFIWVGEEVGEPQRGRALARLAVATPPLRGKARVERVRLPDGRDEWLQVRDGCCLNYRVPGGERCASCPLVDERDRGERLAAELAAAHA